MLIGVEVIENKSSKKKLIYTGGCSEVCNNAFRFWKSINPNLEEQWMFFLLDPSTKDLCPYLFEKLKASISDHKYYQKNKQVRA